MNYQHTCPKCGKKFKGGSQENYCPACKLEMSLFKKNNSDLINKQNEVMNYIRDNQFKEGGITGYEIMRDMGVNRAFLDSMARQDFFGTGAKPGEKSPHPCARCGVTINTGVYCRDCLSFLRKEAKAIGERNEFKKRILLEEELQRINNNLILVVDENNRSADRTKRFLRDYFTDYKIVTSTDLEQTINVVYSLKVKMMLLDDAITENYDGLKILRAIRENARISSTPIITTTTKFDEQKKNFALRLNALDYLEKTIDPDYLIERVNRAFNPNITFKDNLYKILIIDDNEDDVEIEKDILEKNFKCTVFNADSGVEGLSILQSAEKIDLVFISLKMSFMDGFRVLAFIRQNDFFKGFPVIFLSDTEKPEIIELIEKSPAVGYVNKPEFSADSINFIRKILKK
ncbi:MAG: response regulator [Selenomonadaceae bacterium]|nr:response regulator [Selenomonadaceae bacterium]